MADSDDQDRQDIIDKLEAELKVTDKALIEMDEREFEDWMKHMTDGIACLAHESLEAKACADREADESLEAKACVDREADESRSASDSHDLLRDLREDRIKEWHVQWHSKAIQASMAKERLFKFRHKANFEYLERLFLSLEWFLVSAGTQRSLIPLANGNFS